MSNFPPGPTNPRDTFRRFQANPFIFLQELVDTYGDFTYFRLVTRHIYMINDPDLIRQVLVEKADKLARSDYTKETTGHFVGDGLLVSHGEFHHRQRRIMQPLFTPSRVAEYAPIMISECLATLTKWQHNDVRDIAREMMQLTLNIVAKSIFGTNLSDAVGEISSAIDVFQRDGAYKMVNKGNPVSQEEFQKALSTMDNVVAHLIAVSRTAQQGNDLLSLLTNATDPKTGQPMLDKHIRDEAVTLLIGGHESTANLLSWLFYVLPQHPEVESRILDEINSVIGQKAPTLDDIFRLPYTEMVIKETMRLYPPSWLIARQPIEPIELGGFTIQPNATILMSPYVLHRSAKYFDNPDAFIPERFMQEPARYTYVPFGNGPHICIGQSFAAMEATLILATILPRFRFELIPDQVIEAEPTLTLRPKNEIKVRIMERELMQA